VPVSRNARNHRSAPMTATPPASSRCAASHAAMISGPTPAGSPQVKANFVLMPDL